SGGANRTPNSRASGFESCSPRGTERHGRRFLPKRGGRRRTHPMEEWMAGTILHAQGYAQLCMP
ncbi:MAG: hypothetical protein ACO3FE_17545, partial [Planctomycetaceae bacterium]